MHDSLPEPDSPRYGLRWLPAALLVVAFLVHVPTIGAPLVDRHPFRQTQTAYTARIFHEEGIDLLHPTLPVLGAPWEVPFEFPAFQAVASLVMDVGVPEDTALRLTGLVSFLLAGGLLWLLVARQVGWLGATVALGIFLFSTLGIAWGRAALIEYTALAASLGYALSGLRWRDRASGPWFALALALGCLAMMVKITTALFWVVPFVVLAVSRDDDRQTRTSWIGAALLSVIPLAAGLAWTRWADAIKAASDATAWLTSSALTSWNTGTMTQRLESTDAWAAVASSTIFLAGGIALLFLAWPAIRLIRPPATDPIFWALVAGTARQSGRSWSSSTCTSSTITTPLPCRVRWPPWSAWVWPGCRTFGPGFVASSSPVPSSPGPRSGGCGSRIWLPRSTRPRIRKLSCR